MRKYHAEIEYKNKISTICVSGKNEESVIKDITDFYTKIFKEKNIDLKIKLKEID